MHKIPTRAWRAGLALKLLLRPDGKRAQKFFPYSRKNFLASRDKAEVTIGRNTIRVEQRDGGMPVYEIFVDEHGLGCHLAYTAEVNGWKPGTGLSQFGEMGYFGWTIPFARASVSGTITDGDSKIAVTEMGYHDHNWLNFPFPRMINYWLWGRIIPGTLLWFTQSSSATTRLTTTW